MYGFVMNILLRKHLLKAIFVNEIDQQTFIRSTIFNSLRYSSEKKQNSNHDENTRSEDGEPSKKIIKVAVIGAPNAGKSSFINKMLNHRICPTSRKVHTTLTHTANIYNKNDTQMIFFDTPGLSTVDENKKYNLGDTFLRECNNSIENADLIAVIHDVSNSYKRNVLHPTVLETLITHKTIPSILVMNKIDMVRAKRILLDLIRVLTEDTLISKERKYLPWKGREEKFYKDMRRPVKYKTEKSAGWPYFSDVFIVSALSGDGFKRVSDYITEHAIEKPWEYPDYQFTDQRAEDLILSNTRAVLMDFLPAEVPYMINCEMDLFEVKNKRIYAYINLHAKNERIEKVICGFGNKRLKQISEIIVSNIIQLYNANVSIVLNVVSKSKPKLIHDSKLNKNFDKRDQFNNK